MKVFYFLSKLYLKKLSNINYFILKLIIFKINFIKVEPNSLSSNVGFGGSRTGTVDVNQ